MLKSLKLHGVGPVKDLSASFDVTATSVKGQVDNDFPLQPKSHSITIPEKGHSFVGVAGRAASSVFLHTFSGKIRLKQR